MGNKQFIPIISIHVLIQKKQTVNDWTLIRSCNVPSLSYVVLQRFSSSLGYLDIPFKKWMRRRDFSNVSESLDSIVPVMDLQGDALQSLQAMHELSTCYSGSMLFLKCLICE